MEVQTTDNLLKMWAIKVFLASAGLLYISGFTILSLFQEKLILHPKKIDTKTPFRFTVPFEEQNYSPSNGVVLNGLLFRSSTQPAQGLVFYLHGNSDNIQRYGKHSGEFTSRGYDVFFYDYRGFGKSTGKTTDANLYTDAKWLIDSLLKKENPQKVVIYGRSLGTGIATYLSAAVAPNLLVLETPYYSLQDIVETYLPIFPYSKMSTFELPSYQFAPKIPCKTLIIQGTADRIVPYASAQKLSKLIPQVQFVTVVGGHHRGLQKSNEYQHALSKFLE